MQRFSPMRPKIQALKLTASPAPACRRLCCRSSRARSLGILSSAGLADARPRRRKARWRKSISMLSMSPISFQTPIPIIVLARTCLPPSLRGTRHKYGAPGTAGAPNSWADFWDVKEISRHPRHPAE